MRVNLRLAEGGHADIERETQSSRAEGLQPAGDLSRTLHGGAPDDDARNALIEQRLDGGSATHPAADLKVHSGLAGEISNDGGV